MAALKFVNLQIVKIIVRIWIVSQDILFLTLLNYFILLYASFEI